jgi:hypothetical protein
MAALKNIAISIDQTINCCIKLSDGWGSPDEMLSARAWRLRVQHPGLRLWIDRLFFWDADHCQECYVIERNREQLDVEYR